ncbi:MAG: ParB/RepB/Spo0J family partition protein [Lachnospiraceae bacterium]|nr:ParB/RepB/Spo0J family partition protein [Lachnospiraceae bacterium]
MAPKSRGLGRGLDSLIPASIGEDKIIKEVAQKSGSAESTVDINLINPNREQPRKEFNREKLEELADSIKQHGLIEPILVQDRDDHYEIVAGERRWRAAKLAGLKEVPVVIRKFSEQEIVEISLIENIQREDLNAIEEALAYKSLMDKFGLKQDEVAKKVSKNRTTITNSLRLLKLGEKVRNLVIEKQISEGHARALLAIDDEDKQFALAERVIKDKLSVRDIEKLVKEGSNTKPVKKELPAELDIFYKDIAEKMKASLGTKVIVTGKGDGTGKIEIEFYSNDDLDRIKALLK